MAKYKFEQFNVEIENPSVTITGVRDNIQAKMCSVNVTLSTDSASFGIQLSGFEYSVSWEDSDIENFVNLELEKYVVE